MAAAVAFPAWTRRPRALSGLTDSKQLSRDEREAYCDVIRAHGRVGLGAASSAEIDRINIHNATLLAMLRAYRNLGVEAAMALVDGVHKPPLPCPVEPVVKGDAKSLSIAAASVVAKVARDRQMMVLARRYPGYGWESNVGYGADAHYAGLLRLGLTPHHRRSFACLEAFAGDLFTRRFRFEAVTTVAPGIEVFSLRNDFAAVFDGGGCHVGFLKAMRRLWRFRAVGYDAGGQPLTGGGPFASRHEFAVEDIHPDRLERCLNIALETI